MEEQNTNATAALATMNLKDGSGGSDLSSDLSSDDEDYATLPTPPVRTTIHRRTEEDHSQYAELGVNQVTYYPRVNQFIAHKENAATTLSQERKRVSLIHDCVSFVLVVS